MNRLQDELQQKIQLRIEEEKRSSIEKAQISNTRRLKEFLLGFVIWFFSYGLFSLMQGSFKIIVALALSALDMIITRLSEELDLPHDLSLKIRLSAIYFCIILIAIIFY